MKELEVITIDDKNYYILKEKVSRGTHYIYLSNVEDPDDMMIRKSSKEDNLEYVPLENDKEFETACLLLFQRDKR